MRPILPLSISAFALVLVACQPAMFRVLAQVEDGRMRFVAKPWQSWPLGESDKMYADDLVIRDASEIVWAIRRNDDPTCRPQGEHYPFPLTYGSRPRCFVTLVAPKRLVPGTLYDVSAHGFRMAQGYFRVESAVSNYDFDEVQDERRGWSELGDPPSEAAVQNITSP